MYFDVMITASIDRRALRRSFGFRQSTPCCLMPVKKSCASVLISLSRFSVISSRRFHAAPAPKSTSAAVTTPTDQRVTLPRSVFTFIRLSARRNRRRELSGAAWVRGLRLSCVATAGCRPRPRWCRYRNDVPTRVRKARSWSRRARRGS